MSGRALQQVPPCQVHTVLQRTTISVRQRPCRLIQVARVLPIIIHISIKGIDLSIDLFGLKWLDVTKLTVHVFQNLFYVVHLFGLKWSDVTKLTVHVFQNLFYVI